MTASAVAATLIGLGLAVVLLVSNDLQRIGLTLLAVRWRILLVVMVHLPQSLAATLAWRTVIGRPRPGLWTLCRLRWVRDSVNTLLPVARVGGDFIRIRLLAAREMTTSVAAASCIADVSLELTGQAVFTLGAVIWLVSGSHSGNALPLGAAMVAGSLVVAGFAYGAQRLGLIRLAERLGERGGGWETLQKLAGLHDAVAALYRQPRRILIAGAYHLLAWLLGGIETYVALRILGIAAGAREAIIIEALGHASRAAGFLIPGALGVQEGGYLLVCGMFGIAPPQALALSLVQRAREVVLAFPGLMVWHRMEAWSAVGGSRKAGVAP